MYRSFDLSMTPTWLHKFSVRLLKTALGQEGASFLPTECSLRYLTSSDDDEGGQGTAVALESAISKAAGGHLHKYWPIFLEIYLELKTQSALVVRMWERYSVSEQPQGLK
jgi:hypothetical protein